MSPPDDQPGTDPNAGYTVTPAAVQAAGNALCDEPRNLGNLRTDLTGNPLPDDAFGLLPESRHAARVHKQVVTLMDGLLGTAVTDMTDLVNDLFDRCRLYPKNDQDLFQQQQNLRRN